MEYEKYSFFDAPRTVSAASWIFPDPALIVVVPLPVVLPIIIVEAVAADVPILTDEVEAAPVAISTLVVLVEAVPMLIDGPDNASAIRILVDDNLMPLKLPD